MWRGGQILVKTGHTVCVMCVCNVCVRDQQPQLSVSCPPIPPPQDGWTGLILASQNGRADVVRLLLDSRADIHAATKVGRARGR